MIPLSSSTAGSSGVFANRILGIIAFVCTFILSTLEPVEAEMYKWTDKDGTVHFSDDIAKVPSKSDSDSQASEPSASADSPIEGKVNRKAYRHQSKKDKQKRVEGKREIEALINQLKDKMLAADAASKLGEIGDQSAVDPLIELMYRPTHKWFKGKHVAVQALAKIGGRRAIKGFISALIDGDISYEVSHSLRDMNNPIVTEEVISTVCNESENPMIIYESARFLSEMGEKGVDPLLNCLRNLNCACSKRNECAGREAAASFLGRMKEPRAVNPLIEMLKERLDGDHLTNSVHDTAARSLKEITGQNFGQDYRAWAKWLAEKTVQPPKGKK